MKLLILTAFYPVPNGTHERMFVHIRNKYYLENGADVTVLNFDTENDYEIDGIRVISENTYKNSSEDYDIAVCHSANVRNHYGFLKKYEKRFNHLVFFFHGHEVLFLNKDYPKAYDYMKSAKFYRRIMQNFYDRFKMSIWKRYYKELAYKSDFVFVSNWLLKHFKENLKMTESDLKNNYHIINNSVGSFFEEADYDSKCEKKYDFISIRSNMDGSKYCIDSVVALANRYPSEKFLIIGKGIFFEHNKKPENVTWISKTISHEEMKNYLNQSKCGILLTRQDTQGVMTCEFAAYGIPTITSDIEVCHEFFKDRKNVALISNDVDKVDLMKVKEDLLKGLPYEKDKNYFAVNTIKKEMDLYKNILNNSNRSYGNWSKYEKNC